MLNPGLNRSPNDHGSSAKIDSQRIVQHSTLARDKRAMLDLDLPEIDEQATDEPLPVYERKLQADVVQEFLELYSKEHTLNDNASIWDDDDSNISEVSNKIEIIEKDSKNFKQYCADLKINIDSLQPENCESEAVQELKAELYQLTKKHIETEKSQRKELHSLFNSIAKNWSEEVSYGMLDSCGMDENVKGKHYINGESFEKTRKLYQALYLYLQAGHELRESVPLQKQYLDQANTTQFKTILQAHYTCIQEHSSWKQQILTELENLHNKTKILNGNGNEMIKQRFSEDFQEIFKKHQSSELFKKFSKLKQAVDFTAITFQQDITNLWQQWDESIEANHNDFGDASSGITVNTIESDDPRLLRVHTGDTLSSGELFAELGDEAAPLNQKTILASQPSSINLTPNHAYSMIPVDNRPLMVFGAQVLDNDPTLSLHQNHVRSHSLLSIASVSLQENASSTHHAQNDTKERDVQNTHTHGDAKKKKRRRHSNEKIFYQDAQYEKELCTIELKNSYFLQEKCKSVIEKLKKLSSNAVGNPIANATDLSSSKERLEKYLLKMEIHIQTLQENLVTLENHQKPSTTIADYAAISKRHMHQASVIAAIAYTAQGYQLGFHRIKLALTERFGIKNNTIEEKRQEIINMSKAHISKKANHTVRFDTKAKKVSLTLQIMQLRERILEDNKDRENVVKFSKFLKSLFEVLLKETKETLKTVVKIPLEDLKSAIEKKYEAQDDQTKGYHHFFQTTRKAGSENAETHRRARKHHEPRQHDANWQSSSRVAISA